MVKEDELFITNRNEVEKENKSYLAGLALFVLFSLIEEEENGLGSRKNHSCTFSLSLDEEHWRKKFTWRHPRFGFGE